MWHLKIKYRHSDCIYATKLAELKINGFFYFLNEYSKGDFTYTSAMIYLWGEEKKIKKFMDYLKRHPKIVECNVQGNSVLVLAKHRADLVVYKAGYNPLLIYPAPSYLSDEGFEIIELAAWDRKILEDSIKALKKNKTTTYLEILKFSKLKSDDVFVSRILPDLSLKQREAYELAINNGYYSYPRKINLEELAKISKVTKATFRENLRRAEIKMLSILTPR